MKDKLCLIILMVLVFALGVNGAPLAQEKVYSVYDDEGHYIFSTSLGISIGDRYINELNREYRIIEVEGQRGIAQFMGVVDLLADIEKESKHSIKLGEKVLAIASPKGLVGIYHTHTGECYLPSEEIKDGYGEIYEVGAAFTEELRRLGINAIQSWESHLPHDAAAYDRSRVTAVQFLKDGANALFDIHRDGVPRREEYIAMVGGKVISQVRLVVGRQNPNMSVNDQLARRIKANADNQYPGLIKGIFYADGKYNQDLSARAMLLEMGTHVTTKEEAIASTGHLASVVSNVFYGGEAKGTWQALAKAAFKNIALLLFLVSAGIILYLYVTTGSWQGVKERLEHFFRVEFKDILHGQKFFAKYFRNRE